MNYYYVKSKLVSRVLLSSVSDTLFKRSFSKLAVLNGKLDASDKELENGNVRSSNIKKYLETLLSKIYQGGGDKSIHRHTVTNKKILIRERLKMIFDRDSPTLELASLAGMEMDYGSVPTAASVAMIGKIHGLYCAVGGNDATVKGGVTYPISVVKSLRGHTLSFLNYLPSIYIVDTAGAFLPLQAEIFPDRRHGGRTFRNEAVLSSIGVPQLSIVAGSCTAGGAYCPTMTDECIIVKDIGLIYLGGPPLVKAATGEIVTDQELGGAEMHCRISGCTDHFAQTEEEAYEMLRDTILTLNLVDENTSCTRTALDPLFDQNELGDIAGKSVITKEDTYKILARIVDGSAFKEFKAMFGENLIVGFAYIKCQLVGILANCGPLSSADGEKGAHFIELCDRRGISLIFLQNSGNKRDNNFEQNGNVLKNRAKVVAAHSCANVPKITINVGGCFEDDNFIMCGMSFKPNFIFSWPLAHCSLEAPPANKIMEKVLKPDDYTDALFEDTSSAFYRASRIEIDAVVLPENTRETLHTCLQIIQSGEKNKEKALERKVQLPLFRM